MAVATYIGVVQKGLIHLDERVALPEGTKVHVVVPGLVDEHAARRKANRWPAEWVGDIVMADRAEQVQSSNGRLIWRFGAFITSPSHAPLGPIGYVDVDAVNGVVLTDRSAAQEMITRGEHLISTLSSPEG